MTPKTIAFILPNLKQGGAERIVTNLIGALENTEFTPILILLEKEGQYLDLLPPEIKIIDLKTPRIRYSIIKILLTIRRLKPDIVFAGFGELNAYLSPFISLFPNTNFIARETNVVSEHVLRPEIKFWYRFYKNYHAIIAQSKDMQEDLIQNWNIPPDKISRIANPVNISFIAEQQILFKPKAFQHSHKIVVAMGNLSYRKGFDLLLQVFVALKKEPISLFIIGEGPQEAELKAFKQKNELNNVRFLCAQANPYPYLHYADLFVLSSRYEGFPNALLEAGACGTYALAHPCKGGVDEIIIPNLNGELADITQSQQFAAQISSTLTHFHEPRAIQESIAQRYDLPIILKEYLSLFRSFEK